VTVLVDTSVFIDVLRGVEPAIQVVERERAQEPLHSSVVVLAEMLAGMRPREESPTQELIDAVIWHDVSFETAQEAGALGRRWLPSHGGIDTADLIVAATTTRLGARLLTRNVRHFPMFPGLVPPYTS
jgi:predicted nucleic acid-binding protein